MTEDDEADLRLLVQFIQDFYIVQRAQNPGLTSTALPNESSVIRALIRAIHPIAARCVAAQRAELQGKKDLPMPEIDARTLMLALFEDGHLGGQ